MGSRAIALPEGFLSASSLSSKFAAKYAIFVRKLDWVAPPLYSGAQVFAEIGSNLSILQFASFHFRATLRHLSTLIDASDRTGANCRGASSLDLAIAQMFK